MSVVDRQVALGFAAGAGNLTRDEQAEMFAAWIKAERRAERVEAEAAPAVALVGRDKLRGLLEVVAESWDDECRVCDVGMGEEHVDGCAFDALLGLVGSKLASTYRPPVIWDIPLEPSDVFRRPGADPRSGYALEVSPGDPRHSANQRPAMTEDLEVCAGCDGNAVAWQDGPGGAVGWCGTQACQDAIAKARAEAAPDGPPRSL